MKNVYSFSKSDTSKGMINLMITTECLKILIEMMIEYNYDV